MHPEEIKAALRIKGITCAVIADDLLVTKTTVSRVIGGQTKSARIAGYIAQKLGTSVDALWPPKAKVVLSRRGAGRRVGAERRAVA